MSSSYSLVDASADLKAKYQAAMEAPVPKDPISTIVAQFYKDTLKIQQLQNVGLQSSIKSLKMSWKPPGIRKGQKWITDIPL